MNPTGTSAMAHVNSQLIDSRITNMANEINKLTLAQMVLAVAIGDTRDYITASQREEKKFLKRAANCKTMIGHDRNMELARAEARYVETGSKALDDLYNEVDHNDNEIRRFERQIGELNRGLTRRSALCDAPCTDEAMCGACVAFEAEGITWSMIETPSEPTIVTKLASKGHMMDYIVIGAWDDGAPMVSQHDAVHSDSCPCLAVDESEDLF